MDVYKTFIDKLDLPTQRKDYKMKRLFVTMVIAAVLLVSSPGCATLGGHQSWPDNVPQLKADTFMFSKLATRIALKEADMQPEDVSVVKGYLVALKDLLAVPGHPDFTGARLLVAEKLPAKYMTYGLTIIDVLERYLQSAELNVTEDQELVISIISAGIDGATVAVDEFAN